jgi:antimicrobial peptide system SdpB family protein
MSVSERSRPNAAWLDRRVENALRFSAHNPYVGLARSLIALGTLCSLVATPVEHLFYASEARPEGRVCAGVADTIGAFCVVPYEYLNLARWGAALVLVLVVIGLAPRLTAVPHWWISFSFYSSSNVMEGGDQVAAVLTLLLLPVCLTDPRRWHWQQAPEPSGTSTGVRVLNALTLTLVWVQVCFIYFHASIGKLAVPAWRDGTSFWYWALYSPFGIPDHLKWLLEPLLAIGPVLVAMTWGTLLVEFLIACCLFAGHRLRYAALGAGVALHGLIALVIGLPGFSLIMFGALVLYTVRPGDTLPRWVSDRISRIQGRGQKEISSEEEHREYTVTPEGKVKT